MSPIRKRILLVDDDEILRMGLRGRLEYAGYDVHTAEGGQEALQLVDEIEFDLIILDLLMPHPNGFTVYAHLKKISVASRTPILILTVVGLEDDIRKMLEEGAYYLPKRRASKELVLTTEKIIEQFNQNLN